MNKYPELSEAMAGKVLANVFDAVGQEPNTIPLPKLSAYSEYRREKYSFEKTLLAIILVIFCILPLCFIVPKFTVAQTTPEGSNATVFEIKVNSFIPVRTVNVSLEGHNLNVFETGNRVFTVEPTQNGTMTVKVTLANRQWDVKKIDVSGIDNSAPELVKEEKIDNKLVLYLKDEGLGVDWENIYAETLDGGIIKPVSYNEEKGYVIFRFPGESVNIYITDLKGNLLHLVLTT